MVGMIQERLMLVYVIFALTLSLLMIVLWVIEEIRKDATHVDLGWVFGLGVLGVTLAYFAEGDQMRRAVFAGVLSVWALRLGVFLLYHRVGKEEDGRYRALRQKWKGLSSVFFFFVFQAQAFLVLLCSLPFLGVVQNSTPFGAVTDCAALAIFLCALLGETLSDRQLQNFRMKPENRGRVCESGFWAYSRHPNYFFEWLFWFFFVFMSIGSEWFLLSLSGPVVMGLLLWRFTGIPYNEEQNLRTKGDAYRDYQDRVSAFFLWFPKKNFRKHSEDR